MLGLELPEWGSYQNLLLVEWFERERSEKLAAMWALSESLVVSQMDPSISWADRMVYIRRAMERYRTTVWQTKYSPKFMLDRMRRKYQELKGDLDRLDAIGDWG